MSAWTYPIQMHPWLRMPSHKRKVYQRDSSDSSDPELVVPLKRRRCDVLTNGFAQLSLDPAALNPQPIQATPQNYPYTVEPPPDEDLDMSVEPIDPWVTAAPSVRTSPADATSVVLPGSVEEPTSPAEVPDVPDVTMKSRSWYEPEKDRIVIVDLDDDSDVEEEEQTVQVNKALMARLLSRQSTFPVEPDDDSKALVLFKPLVVPPPTNSGVMEERQEGARTETGLEESRDSIDMEYSRQPQPVVEDDPMDIEMF